MPTTMTFERVQKYLDAIAANGSPINQSPHGAFWKVSYEEFIAGSIPGGDRVVCHKNGPPFHPTPIIAADPAQSPFYLILTNKDGWCDEPTATKPQMPEFGPFITDPGYVVTVDGAPVTGAQIQADLLEWLTHGHPK